VAYSDHFPDRAPGTASVSARLLDPHYLYEVLRRRRRRIATTFVILLLAFAALLALLAPRYSATAIVLVDPRQQRVLQSDAVLSGIGNDMAAVDSQVEVVQSAPIAIKVIKELKLDEDPEFGPSDNPLVALLRMLTGEQPETRMRSTLSRFGSNLKVRRRGVTYVLEIEFLSRSPERSAQVANAIAKTYIDQQEAAKSGATSDASNFLGERLVLLRKQSSDADAAVARYRAESGLVNSGDKRSVVEQQLAETNQQLVAAGVRKEEIESRLKQIEKAGANAAARSSLVEALSSPVITALRAQYAVAAKTSAELAQSLGPRHPAVKTSNAELAAIAAQIDTEISRLAAGVRNEFEAAQAREKSLQASLEKLKTATASNDRATVRLHELEREADAAQTILQRSLVRYKETREQEGVQAADVRILSPAAVPLTSAGPNRKLLLALATFASLGLAIAFAVATDATEHPVAARAVPAASPAPAVAQAPVAVADVLPGAAPPNPALAAPMQHPLRLPTFGLLPNVGASRTAGDAALARFSFQSAFSPFVEGVGRMVRDFTIAHPGRPHILALTSLSRGAGVSTVASGFAHAFRRNGEKTLLIDATVGQIDASHQAMNMMQLFQAKLPLDSAIHRNGNGVDTLIGGAGNSGDLLPAFDSLQMNAMLQQLRSRYAVIVIDTGLQLTDTQTQRFLALADSALLVVSGTESSKLLEQPVFEALQARRGKFDGMIVNHVDLDLYQAQRLRDQPGGAAPSPLMPAGAG
jgi:succinoglycan biosynthesis transport protein ExoP